MKKPKFNGGGNAQFTSNENSAHSENAANGAADDSIQAAMQRYSGMNESQLMTEMLARAAEGRRNGTLSDADLDDFYAKAAPALSPAQRDRLKGLVDSLKHNK